MKTSFSEKLQINKLLVKNKTSGNTWGGPGCGMKDLHV